MILIELLASGERTPRDQFVNVGVAGVVADLLRFEAGPGRRRDDLARLRHDVAKTDLLVFLRHGEMRVIAARRLRQRLPGFDRDLAVRFRREREDYLSGVDVGVDLRHAPGRSVLSDRAVEALEQINLVLGVPGDAFHGVTELGHQWSKRGEPLVDIRIVALDHGDRRHRLAGDRFDVPCLPLLDVDGLGQFVRGVVLDRRENNVFLDT